MFVDGARDVLRTKVRLFFSAADDMFAPHMSPYLHIYSPAALVPVFCSPRSLMPLSDAFLPTNGELRSSRISRLQ
jgi:hypothetical protein